MNSSEMIEIRRKMVEGEKVDQCRRCYTDEEKIGASNRTRALNEEWMTFQEDEDTIMDSLAQGYLIDRVAQIDVRLDKLCNLQCRMCGSWASTSILADDKKIAKEEPDYFRQVHFRHPDKSPRQEFPDRLKQDILDSYPFRTLLLSGGEPMMIQQYGELLDEMIDLGHSKDVGLVVISNATKVNDDWIRRLSGFQWANIMCSIDGHGSTDEYVRYPSSFDQVSANVERLLRETEGVDVGMITTGQIYNFLNLVPLVEWYFHLFQKTGNPNLPRFILSRLQSPEFLSVNLLPNHLRERGLQVIRDIKEILVQNTNRHIERNAMPTLELQEKHLQQEVNENAPVYLNLKNRLRYYTKFHDKRRGQELRDVSPEIADWLDQ